VKTACRHSKPHAAAAEFRNQIGITPIKLYHSAHQISIVTYAIAKKKITANRNFNGGKKVKPKDAEAP